VLKYRATLGMLLGFSSHRYTLWVNGSLQTEILDKSQTVIPGLDHKLDIAQDAKAVQSCHEIPF
jgi:hypothetical protein